jgi:hypothetical protein
LEIEMTQNVKATQAAKEAAKVDAIIAADLANQALLADREAVRQNVFTTAKRNGDNAAFGDNGLAATCFLYNDAVRRGHMNADDAGAVYAAYAEGYNLANAAGHVMLGNVKVSTRGDGLFAQDVNADEKEANRAKVSASLVRTFGKPGCVAQGAGWFDRVRMVRDTVAVDDRAQSSMFNAWVASNRVANDAKEGEEITDAMIVAALTKEGKAAKKTALEKLTRLVADAAKLAKANPDFVGLDKVAAVLGQIEAAAKLGIKMEHRVPEMKTVPASELIKPEGATVN